MAEPHVWEPQDRPTVEVRVNGQWYLAELRMRTQLPDGRHRYNACWHPDTGGSRLDDFDQDDVREDTVDRARGRG